MYQTAKSWTHQLFAPGLGGRIGYITDWFIMVLIAVNVLAVMFETVDTLATRYEEFFYWFEVVSVAIFTAEYLGRVWSCIEDPRFDGPISGRLKWASQPLAVVDLLAILPFYFAFMGLYADLRFLRALRLIRFFRLFKLARYSDAIQAFAIVARSKREDLIISITATGLVWVVASSIMYYIENDAQPEVFSSIPATLWWGVITLTTVGYGDTYPITPLGKVFGAIVALLGIGLVALPASILASGFIEETIEEEEGITYCPHCGESLQEFQS